MLTISGCTLAALIIVGLIVAAIWFLWLRALIKERQQNPCMRRQRLIVQQRVPVTSSPTQQSDYTSMPVGQYPAPTYQPQHLEEFHLPPAPLHLHTPLNDFTSTYQQQPATLMPTNRYDDTGSYNNVADSSFANVSLSTSTQNSYLHSDIESPYSKSHATPYVPRYIKRAQQLSAV